MTARTFTVDGHRVRSASQRRYVVVIFPRVDAPFFPPYIWKRSDSVEVVRGHVRRYGIRAGSYAKIVDTVTGDFV